MLGWEGTVSHLCFLRSHDRTVKQGGFHPCNEIPHSFVSCSHAIVSDSAELVDILKPRMFSVRKKFFPDASPFEEGQKDATVPDTSNKRYSKMRQFTE